MGNLTKFSKAFAAEVFIETGTYLGDTLEIALQAGVPTLHSIEVHEPNYLKAKERFAEAENVHIHLGSSPDILPLIIDGTKSTTFWLDAHFQGYSRDEQDNQYGECPLLAELAAIFAVQWDTPPIVLIDDAHMFDERISIDRGFDPAQWPTMEQIRAALPANYLIEECDVDFWHCFASQDSPSESS